MIDQPANTTHFGFKDVPLGEKQTLVNDVFHSVAQRYDLMNDLMSAGMHRLWKEAMITALNPPRGDQPFALLDVAGGTGDIALPRRQGSGRRVSGNRMRHQLRYADRRPRARRCAARGRAGFVRRRQCGGPAFPERSFDAYTIAFGIRNVPRIDLALNEAFRVLRPGGRFLCLEFSTVDVPGLDRIYDLFSFKLIPPLGRAVTGDAKSYRYLVEIDPQVSQVERVCRDHSRQRAFPASTGKALAAASWRCIRAGVCDLSVDPHRAAGPRRLRIRARGRVRRRRSVTGASARPTGAATGAYHRASRRQVRSTAVARADAVRASLSEARPVSRHASRRGRRGDGARSGKLAGSAAAVCAKRGRSRHRAVAGTAAGAVVCEPWSRRCRGLDRAGTSRGNRAGWRAQIGCGEGAAAQRGRAVSPRPRRLFLCRAQCRNLLGGGAPASAD